MIIIPVKAPKQDAEFSPFFGRAPFFALVDPETDEITFMENALDSGRMLAELFGEAGVTAVIAKEMGPRPLAALMQSNTNVYFAKSRKGSLKEVWQAYKNGELNEIDQQTTAGFVSKGRHRNRGLNHGKRHGHSRGRGVLSGIKKLQGDSPGFARRIID